MEQMTERELLIRLAERARVLCVVVNNALTNNSIEPGYEDMLRNPMNEVEAILAFAPLADQWDGTFNMADVEEKLLHTPGDERYASPPTGIELHHKPTGLRRQSLSMGSVEDNRAVAHRALEQAVLARWRQQSGLT